MQVCSLSKNWKEAQNNKLQSKLNLEAQKVSLNDPGQFKHTHSQG